jgi:hypothetical protein
MMRAQPLGRNRGITLVNGGLVQDAQTVPEMPCCGYCVFFPHWAASVLASFQKRQQPSSILQRGFDGIFLLR